ncbi:MAG TPA: S41 family peptidase, partial [Gaiellaceae bacterium]|nr:S41 family peptidase [Gaiellaceae bacterium]
DTIVGIGGTPAGRLGATQALARILGPRGTHVRLQLLRHGRLLHLRVRRDVVPMPVVHARLLSYAGRRWGEVRLSSFGADTAGLLRRELAKLRRQGALGFVLDLRGNPGGLLDQAVAVSSLFLDHGVIVSLSGAHTPLHTYRAGPRAATGLPLVVLVDRYSASSAEVVAAALSDNRRATVVGERTFGKALVQSLDPLGNGAALELTVAHYYTPAGQDISGSGVVPQVVAADDPRTPEDEALGAALRVLARPAS